MNMKKTSPEKYNPLPDSSNKCPFTDRGAGGELRQKAQSEDDYMTTQQGVPVSDDQNSLKAGSRGPSLLEDQVHREKIFHFDHERIPERVVHARGYGARGYFENYEDLSDLTSADLFQRAGEKTETFARFSTVAGSAGSPDLARDVRGFAVKFYTQKGNWDLVGNNIPVFFIQDGMKFPDLIHAAKPEPDRGFPQAQTAHDNFWDFMSLMPEATHMIMWIMSDRTIPRSLRFMEGFGVHTFRLVNATGVSTFVKFHWKPKLGMQSVVWNEAVKINGADPDFHRRDMWDSIKAGDFPEWELGIQIVDDEVIEKFPFDILDATKLIPEELAPIKIIGKLVLDQVVDNFFAETEQVAFCTQNLVVGIEHSNDPLLQSRNFSYLDTQLKRLGGPNFSHIPVNAPRCPMRHFQQDGHMAMHNPKGRANYEPNSWEGEERGPRETDVGFKTFPEPIEKNAVKIRERSETFSDHFSQARQFYVSQTKVEQEHICSALVFELSKVKTEAIRSRLMANLLNVDENLVAKVADGLGMDIPEKAKAAREPIADLPASPALSILKNPPETFAGRKVGVLVTDGVDQKLFDALQAAAKKEGAMMEVIAPKVGGVKSDSGTLIKADEKLGGGPSVLYDSVAILISEDGATELAKEPAARDFISDAIAHYKFIAYSAGGKSLLKELHLEDKIDDGFTDISKPGDAKTFLTECRKLRFWDRPGA